MLDEWSVSAIHWPRDLWDLPPLLRWHFCGIHDWIDLMAVYTADSNELEIEVGEYLLDVAANQHVQPPQSGLAQHGRCMTKFLLRDWRRFVFYLEILIFSWPKRNWRHRWTKRSSCCLWCRSVPRITARSGTRLYAMHCRRPRWISWRKCASRPTPTSCTPRWLWTPRRYSELRRVTEKNEEWWWEGERNKATLISNDEVNFLWCIRLLLQLWLI